MRSDNNEYVPLWSNKERYNHFNYLENDFIKRGKKGMGVREDDHVYYKKSYQQHGLTYSRPCLCGSCEHRNIHHRDCLLNPIYEDI